MAFVTRARGFGVLWRSHAHWTNTAGPPLDVVGVAVVVGFPDDFSTSGSRGGSAHYFYYSTSIELSRTRGCMALAGCHRKAEDLTDSGVA
jgi:hypothetical protein